MLGTAAILLLAGGYLWLLGGPTPPGNAVLGGPWTLTRADGQIVSDRDFRGRFLLIYFGYTSCPDVCPMTLSAVSQAMQQLGARASRLQPLFISIDPEHDTPEVVRRYVGGFGPGLIGLTGTPAQVRAVQQEYRMHSVVHHVAGRRDYAVDHTAALLLIGPDGRYLTPLAADGTPAEIAAHLAPYLS